MLKQKSLYKFNVQKIQNPINIQETDLDLHHKKSVQVNHEIQQ